MTTPLASTWKGVKRFYSRIDVQPVPNSALWQVLIEGRALRTNGMHELLVPTRSLALAIAGEFAMQGAMVIPATTPIYNLASAAIDNYVHEDMREAEDMEATLRASKLSTFDRIVAHQEIEERRAAALRAASASASASAAGGEAAKVTDAAAILRAAAQAEGTQATPAHAMTMATGRSESGAMGSTGSSGTSRVRDLALDYLETDTVCYRVDWDMADPSERLLRKRQDKYYEPIMRWFEDGFGVRLGLAVGLEDLVHPDAAYDVAEDSVDTADPWLKAFYGQTLGCLKSTTLAIALAHRYIDVDGAFAAARVEEEWQIGEHGFVEGGGHDTSRAYLRLQLTSAAAYLNMLPKGSLPAPLPSASRKDHAALLAAQVADRRARVEGRRAREADLVARKRALMKEMARQEAEEDMRARDEEAAKAFAATTAAGGKKAPPAATA
jgi:chaperone required for assembly of F1-ATPase